MENIVEFLHKLSYEPDFQPIPREDLARMYNEKYGTTLPLNAFSAGLRLADEILASDHTRKRKAMMFFIAGIPLVDFNFARKLKEIARYKLDQDRRMTVFSLKDDGKVLFQTRKEYTQSVEIFCYKLFKHATAPMSREAIYERFMESGYGYSSLESFILACKKVIIELLDSNENLEIKAKFCFVAGFEVPDRWLAKWTKLALVEVDQWNRIIKFKSKFCSFEKEERAEKRQIERDEEVEPTAKRVMDSTVSLGNNQPSEVPLVYQPLDSMIASQGSVSLRNPSQSLAYRPSLPISTWPSTGYPYYGVPAYNPYEPVVPPAATYFQPDSTVSQPITSPVSNQEEQVTTQNPEAAEMTVPVETTTEPTPNEPETHVGAPSAPEEPQMTKNKTVAEKAPVKINDEPKDTEAQEQETQEPVVQKKKPIIIKKETPEVAPAEPRAPEASRPTEEEPAETEMEVSVETTQEPVTKMKPRSINQETPEVAPAEKESRPKVNVKPEPEDPEVDAPDAPLAQPAHCESPLTPPITPPLDPAQATEQPSEKISEPQTSEAVEMEVLVEIPKEPVSKAPESQESISMKKPISIKQEAPEDDAPAEAQASRPKINIKSEPMNAEDDAPDASTPSPVYTVLNEFYMMLSDVLIKFGSANFKETEEKWVELLREVKKNDGPALTSQEVITQFAACLERRLVGSSPGSSAEIITSSFMYRLERGMNSVHFGDEEANKLWKDLRRIFGKVGNRVKDDEVFKIADIDSCFMRIPGLLLYIL